MELWIRSQDKERIIKVNNIFIHQDNNHLICANQRAIDQFNDESFELGAYSSRKRALEVLDEIQRILKPIIKSYTPLTESKEDYKNHCMKTELVGYETTYDIVALPTYVYEMPEE